MSANQDREVLVRLFMGLQAAEALLRDVIAELTVKTEAISELRLRVKDLEEGRSVRNAMDAHILTHLREGHDPRDTANIFDCWVCLPYMIPDEVRAALSNDTTREF